MRTLFSITFLAVFSFPAFAQQTTLFSQYLMNLYGINPAVGGTQICWDFRIGYRKQWAGFPGAPITKFVSAERALNKNGFKRGWHGVGFYAEEDRAGPFAFANLSGSYSYHLKLNRKWTASAGIAIGLRQYKFNTRQLNIGAADPSFANSRVIWIYPNISAGVFAYSKKTFASFSIRQIYKNKLKEWGENGGAIGSSPAKLRPHYYLILGKKIEDKHYYYTYIPSVQILYTLVFPPSIDFSFQWWVKQKIGFGMSYRTVDALVGMIQFKHRRFTFGYSYDLTTSKIRKDGSGTHEFIFVVGGCPEAFYEFQRKKNCAAYQ